MSKLLDGGKGRNTNAVISKALNIAFSRTDFDGLTGFWTDFEMILNAFNDDVRLFVFKWSKHMVNWNGEETLNLETEYAGDVIQWYQRNE